MKYFALLSEFWAFSISKAQKSPDFLLKNDLSFLIATNRSHLSTSTLRCNTLQHTATHLTHYRSKTTRAMAPTHCKHTCGNPASESECAHNWFAHCIDDAAAASRHKTLQAIFLHARHRICHKPPCACIYMCIYMCIYSYVCTWPTHSSVRYLSGRLPPDLPRTPVCVYLYVVATISRILKITGLCCRISSLL